MVEQDVGTCPCIDHDPLDLPVSNSGQDDQGIILQCLITLVIIFREGDGAIQLKPFKIETRHWPHLDEPVYGDVPSQFRVGPRVMVLISL